MVIDTKAPEVIDNRRQLLQKYIDNHHVNCLVCQKSGQCKLQEYCYKYGVDKTIPNSLNLLPIDDPKSKEKMEKFWNVEHLSPFAGVTVVEMINKIAKNEMKFLYVMGENPLMTDPNLKHVRSALKNLDLFVVQDIFLTETAAMADIVLPATCFAEKVGTFTNTGRRIQRVRAVVTPPGEVKMDLDIILELMDRMGYKQVNRTPETIFNELCEVTPLYNGFNYSILEEEGVVFVPFHFSSALVNELTGSEFLEPISKTPEYKICPVKLI